MTKKILIGLLILISIPFFVISIPAWAIWGIYKQNWKRGSKTAAIVGVIVLWFVAMSAYANTDFAKALKAESDAKRAAIELRESEAKEQQENNKKEETQNQVLESSVELPAPIQEEEAIEIAQTTPDSTVVEEDAAPAQEPENSVSSYDVTMNSLWESVDSVFGTRKGIDVTYYEEQRWVTVTRTDVDVWDENDLVEKGFSSLVYYGKSVFQNANITQVEININTTFTDSYGQKSTEEAMRVGMNKETFEKFNWDNLKYEPIYSQMSANAQDLYIHPGVLKNVTISKVSLEGSAK